MGSLLGVSIRTQAPARTVQGPSERRRTTGSIASLGLWSLPQACPQAAGLGCLPGP